MRRKNEKQLLSSIAAEEYVGNADDVERLYLRAISGAGPFRMRVTGRPGSGTSELLRKVYDRLFYEQRFVLPFYFALRSGDTTARSTAARYAYQFLLQAIAFRRNDPELIAASPDICELAKLAPMADAAWVERMCEVCRNDGPLNDDRAFIRSALAAPMRAASAAGLRVNVIVDDLHESEAIKDGELIVDELLALTANESTRLTVGARRRFRFPDQSFEAYPLTTPRRDEIAVLIEILAADLDISLGEQARDLITVKFNGDFTSTRSFLFAASEYAQTLDGFRDVEQLYVEQLINGDLGRRLDANFARAAADPTVRRKLIEALYSSVTPELGGFAIGALRDRLEVSVEEITRLSKALELSEILDISNGIARVSKDVVLRDYLRLRATSAGSTSAQTAAVAVTNALKRAPLAMSRVYRNEASIGLQEFLSGFDIRVVPRALIDYRAFRDRYKGLAEGELRLQIADDTESVVLPQIVHASPIVEHHPEFGEPVEPERAIAGIGFSERLYRDEDQVTWLVVEIDSKLEADRTVAHEWCDRLAAAAAGCEFSNYRVWLISPEGFSDGALDLISERNGFGSSRRQVDLLRKFLNYDEGTSILTSAEYEIVIPIGNETELIAAHTLEEIARRYEFPAKAVNQIKLALVEACINAAEHSLSPDKKIYQKFAVDAEKIVITISNRGLRFVDKAAAKPALENAPSDSRRGWGLNLIRGLMDDVRIESVDDGTRIVMTKYLRK